ncbi:MAG: YaeQ family protein [bacterium]|nr:YaeQ family protein [bacterium]
MARGATIYKASLELSLVDRNVYDEVQVTIARHPSETHERTLVRALAFALRYDRDLEFGRGVSATDEPDLWSRAGDGRPREWIEVGQPDGKRLVKAGRQSERTTVFAFGEGVERWREAQIGSTDLPANVSVARIDDGFLAALAAVTDRQLRWTVTLSDGIVFLASGEDAFETPPEVWLGDPLA